MTKDEAKAVYVAHCNGIEVPVDKFLTAMDVLAKEGVLVR